MIEDIYLFDKRIDDLYIGLIIGLNVFYENILENFVRHGTNES